MRQAGDAIRLSRSGYIVTERIKDTIQVINEGAVMELIRETMDLGREIRARRKELGYTQAYIADHAKVSVSFLSELENGKETIQINKLMDVLSVLGLDLCVARKATGESGPDRKK